MSRPLHVFLCHASQDKPAVKKLYRYLVQRGGQPWLDELDLLPGQYWKTEIPRALFSSDVILVCLSKNSINKEGYVQKEIAFALDKAQEKPEGTIFIIPVKLEECEVPQRLSMYQWVEYFRADGRKRLLRSLNLRAASLGGDVSPVLLDITHRRKPIESDLAKREAREKVVREQTEREAIEKLDREKVEQETKEKAEHEAVAKALREKQEREQKEQTEREAAEKLAREKAEQEAREKAEHEAVAKALREKQEHEQKEQAEREAAEKLAREKAEQEAKEKTERQQRNKRNVSEKNTRQRNPSEKYFGIGKLTPTRTKLLPWLALLVGIILIALLLPDINALLNNFPASTPEITFTPTKTPPSLQFTETNTPPTPQLTETNTPPTPTFSSTLFIGSTMVSEKDNMVMVYVPEGEFVMGNDTGRANEEPAHQVYLDAFWIDRTEVTNAMYIKCVEEGSCTPPSSTRSYSRDITYYGTTYPSYPNFPVVYIDWHQASAYCLWADRELPTEAQWEKAARGVDGRSYPWGEGIDCSYANYWGKNKGCVGDTTEAGFGIYEKGISPFGVYDMAGNVWEWVKDFYNVSYYQESPLSNPVGPDFGETRVLKGGSWGYEFGIDVYSAKRLNLKPTYLSYEVGFRCSLSHP